MTTAASSVYRAIYVNEDRLKAFEKRIDQVLASQRHISDLNTSSDAQSLSLEFDFSDCLNVGELQALRALYPSWNITSTCDTDLGTSKVVLNAVDLNEQHPEVEVPLEDIVDDLVARFESALGGGSTP